MRRRLAAGIVVLATLLPFGATAHALLAGPTLRHVPVGVVGPVLVAQAVSDSLTSLEGQPFDGVVYATGTAGDDGGAPYDVATGRLGAAVVLDLAASRDTLYVATTASDDYVDEIRSQARAVAAGYGREVVVERVSPASGSASTGAVARWLVAGWCLVGVVLAGAVTALRGPVAPTARRGAARVAALGGMSALVGGVSGAIAATVVPSYDVVAVAGAGAVGAVLTATVAWVVTAVEALAGLAGLPAASALVLAPATTLLVVGEPDTLPAPWHVLHRFLPHDGADALLRHLLLGEQVATARAVVVLAAWAVVALLVLPAARRERPR